MERQLDFQGIITPDGSFSYNDFSSDFFGLRGLTSQGSNVLLLSDSAVEILACLSVLNGWAQSVSILPAGSKNEINANFDVILSNLQPVNRSVNQAASENSPKQIDTQWILYTSGTTGRPKPAAHKFHDLSRRIKQVPSNVKNRWGLLYHPSKMAGIQVVLQAYLTESALIVPKINATVTDKLDFLIENECNSLSATPTFWRQILQSGLASKLNLLQITLGGEISDQKLLDSLATEFSNSRISQIYASTELGPLFSVKDGKAGFPASYLQTGVDGMTLEIRNDVLFVQTHPNGIEPSELRSTQDYVKQVGDRIYFLGRESGLVNIGGVKVWVEQVEEMIRSHEEVDDVIVIPIPSQFSGNLLKAHIVTRKGASKEFPIELRKWLRNRVEPAFIPAVINVVESLDVTSNGKVKRN